MGIDRFDKTVAVLVALFVMGAAAVYTYVPPEVQAISPAASRVKVEVDPAIYPRLDAARDMMEAGLASEALAALEGISGDYPAVSEPHALMGQAYSRLLDYPNAMREFRLALLMDASYVDKKSKKFIGKRIQATLKDGMSEAKAALDANPSDEAAKAALKDAYYIERMLAGGCE